jgi:hypothetical protein
MVPLVRRRAEMWTALGGVGVPSPDSLRQQLAGGRRHSGSGRLLQRNLAALSRKSPMAQAMQCHTGRSALERSREAGLR